MALFDFLKRKPTIKCTVAGQGVSQSKPDLVKSQYSSMPRFFVIDGVKYDLDNATSISHIPIFENTFLINGKTYGMDTVLYEHYCQCSNDAIRWAAYEKSQEFRKHGIVHPSQREVDWQMHERERQAKEALRKKQCDSFTIEDMYGFADIPFGFHWVKQLFHTDGIAWFMLNKNNQEVAISYISQINDIILDAQEYIDGIQNTEIDLTKINFDYPRPLQRNSMTCTRVECYPYTPSGKKSKYPIILHFETHPYSCNYTRLDVELSIVGDINILCDGNIGSAVVRILGNTFRFGLHGLSLVLKRVDNPYGNLFKFSEQIE